MQTPFSAVFENAPSLGAAFSAGAAVYGIRYFLLAGIFFALARSGLGRPLHAEPGRRDLLREIGYSLGTIALFGAVAAVLYSSGIIRHSQVYFRVESPAWFWLSIPVMLFVHDTLFYWLHRLMHHPALFRRVHLVHHLSVKPSAWAAYSFHPREALLEELLVVLIVFTIPSHPAALMIFQSLSTLINVYGHCGREFYPEGWHRHWMGKWINTSTLHDRHHHSGRGNYGLYLLFWDRLMGTVNETP